MTPDLEVDTGGLRQCARGLADTAARVRTGLHDWPPLGGTAPGWATAAAVEVLRNTTARQFAAVASAIEDGGAALATTAQRYDAADERAACRLWSV